MPGRSSEWVASNLRHAVYNLADENIRYLYNNWVGLLPRPEDRERAVRGRLAVESRLAGKFAEILEQGADPQKKELLEALTELPLRRGDVYDPHPICAALRRRSTTGSATTSSRSTSSARAPIAWPARCCPCSIPPTRKCERLARDAILMVRENHLRARSSAPPEDAARPRSSSRTSWTPRLKTPKSRAPSTCRLRATPTPLPPRPRPPPTAPLDEAFFRANIEPILRKKGADGYACLNCHNTHTLFNATWSTVKNVIDRRDPENSLLLPKTHFHPRNPRASPVPPPMSHGGGQRWPKGSPEYETILKWIDGRP